MEQNPGALCRNAHSGRRQANRRSLSTSFDRFCIILKTAFGHRRRREVTSSGEMCRDRQVRDAVRFSTTISWNQFVAIFESGNINRSSHGDEAEAHSETIPATTVSSAFDCQKPADQMRPVKVTSLNQPHQANTSLSPPIYFCHVTHTHLVFIIHISPDRGVRCRRIHHCSHRAPPKRNTTTLRAMHTNFFAAKSKVYNAPDPVRNV